MIPKITKPLAKSLRTLEGWLVVVANGVLVVVPIVTNSLPASQAVKYGVILNGVYVVARTVLKSVTALTGSPAPAAAAGVVWAQYQGAVNAGNTVTHAELAAVPAASATPPRADASRALHLTSPLLHGPDVHDLQVALNAWLSKHRRAKIQVDGQYGPQTQHAVGVVAWALGCLHRDGRVSVQQAILHPDHRPAGDLERAKHRAEEQKKQGSGLAGIVKHAEQYIGVHEDPPGSNRGTPNPSGWEKEFGIDGEPWCGAFAGNMILLAGGHVTGRVVFCPNIVNDAHAGADGFARWYSRGQEADVRPGCLILYDWNGDGEADHVGIVKTFADGSVFTIEGNTSKQDDPNGSQSDGGIVAERERPIESYVMGYAEPRF